MKTMRCCDDEKTEWKLTRSKPLKEFGNDSLRRIKYLLTDIDGTMTCCDGRLPADSYGAMERLRAAGISVIPITGRPAGWCDQIARMWPVDGVVGENGALFFYFDEKKEKMVHRFAETRRKTREKNMEKLKRFFDKDVKKKFPRVDYAADQPYRETDVAIDYAEDIKKPYSKKTAFKIKEFCESRGFTAKVSSIHVNTWIGDYTKLDMSIRVLKNVFKLTEKEMKTKVTYAGDSDNDSDMFGYFDKTSVGMANVHEFAGMIENEPAYVASGRGAVGFVQLADALIAARRR